MNSVTPDGKGVMRALLGICETAWLLRLTQQKLFMLYYPYPQLSRLTVVERRAADGFVDGGEVGHGLEVV